MENAENLTILKNELRLICEQLTKQMDKLDDTTTKTDVKKAKLAC